MGFLSPWFLAGLLAAGIPVYFHLLRQHKSTPQPFSSLMFFEPSTESSIRYRRLRYLALLAMRVALLALLAFAFASPYVLRTEAAGGNGRSLVLVVVDNSFSMREGDRLARAKREALATLSSLSAGGEGQVAALNEQLQLLTQRSAEFPQLRAAVESINHTDRRSSFGELARAIRSLQESTGLALDVHLFSDMQRTSMPPGFADLNLGQRTRLTVHAMAENATPNFLIENVVAPGSLFQSLPGHVQVTVSGYNTGAARRTVSLLAGGKPVESKTVELAANGRATVEFRSLTVPHGFTRCEVLIDSADGLEADDRFRFAVERTDPWPVLFVHGAGDTRSPLYFRSALEAVPNSRFRFESRDTTGVAGIDPSRYPVVVLSDAGSLPEGFERKLVTHVSNGGAVLVAAGPATARRLRVPVFGGEVSESRYSTRSGQRFETAASFDPTHACFRKASGWDTVKFYQTIRVAPGEGQVVARLSDETPLLVERRLGEGRVMLFASTFDNISNDLPLHALFVPFVEQTLSYLGGIEQRTSNQHVGSFLELRAGGAAAQGVAVIDPDGVRALSLEESATAQTFQVNREGFYELRRANNRTEMVAVNADRRESDLTPVPAETLALWQNTGEGSEALAGEVRSERKPWSFWWYLLVFGLGMALCEALVGSRYLSVERGPA